MAVEVMTVCPGCWDSLLSSIQYWLPSEPYGKARRSQMDDNGKKVAK